MGMKQIERWENTVDALVKICFEVIPKDTIEKLMLDIVVNTPPRLAYRDAQDRMIKA